MRNWVLCNSRNEGVVETSLVVTLDSASTVVRKFYEGINGHDLASVENLIAENCVYEDLIFPQPFVGRKVSFLNINLIVPYHVKYRVECTNACDLEILREIIFKSRELHNF